MMAIDDLLATIPTLQRGDLEGWIRDELVAPQSAR
jgi:chaperone modulatory protein CbpM